MNGFQIKCKHNHFLQLNSGEEKCKRTFHKRSLTFFIIYADFPFFSLIRYFLEKRKNTEQINNVLPFYKDLLYFQKWGKLAHDFHFKSDALAVMIKNKNPDKLHPVSLCHCQVWDTEKDLQGCLEKSLSPAWELQTPHKNQMWFASSNYDPQSEKGT